MRDVDGVVNAESDDDDDAHADDGVDGQAPEVGNALEEEEQSKSLDVLILCSKVISQKNVQIEHGGQRFG